jgi:hypothetical protein
MSGFSSPSGGDGGSAPADWPFVTVAEAARMVPYSERWIRKKVEKGLLRAWYEEQDGKEVLVVNKNELIQKLGVRSDLVELLNKPVTSCDALREAISMLEAANDLYEAGHTLAASGELRGALRVLKALDLDPATPLPPTVEKALKYATDYFRTRGTIEAALAFAALQALQIAELKTLTIGQQEQFAHRMAELVRAYLTGGKK